MEAVDIKQLESFDAGCLFAQAEGIIPAPESCQAIAATIREANKCKETGEEKVILFNLSGHGLIDMASYDKYLSGDLEMCIRDSLYAGAGQHVPKVEARGEDNLAAINRACLHIFQFVLALGIDAGTETAELTQLY